MSSIKWLQADQHQEAARLQWRWHLKYSSLQENHFALAVISLIAQAATVVQSAPWAMMAHASRHSHKLVLRHRRRLVKMTAREAKFLKSF